LSNVGAKGAQMGGLDAMKCRPRAS